MFAWQTAWCSGGDLRRLCDLSLAVGTAHNHFEWGKLLWAHLWINHMYHFAKRWRILSKFSCPTTIVQQWQLGKVTWLWWAHLRWDFGWMMWNESGARVADFNMLPIKTKKMDFSWKKIQTRATSHESESLIQTAASPPFTKNT